MTFTRDDRTVLGDSPAQVAPPAREYGADLIGVNCSGGPAQLCAHPASQMRQAVPDGPFFGDAQRRLARTGGRAHHVPGQPGLLRRLRPGLLRSRRQPGRRLLRHHPAHIAAMRAGLDRLPGGCGPSIWRAGRCRPRAMNGRACRRSPLAAGPKTGRRQLRRLGRDGPAARAFRPTS